jgi:hypothetical protein
MENKALCGIAFAFSLVYAEFLFGTLCYEAGADGGFSKQWFTILFVSFYFILAFASYQFFQNPSPFEKTYLALAIVYPAPFVLLYLVVLVDWLITKNPILLEDHELLWQIFNFVGLGLISGIYLAVFFRIRKENSRFQ